MMTKSGSLAGNTIRRIFGMDQSFAERRVANLPHMVERRRGPRCDNCGVGTLHPLPAGHPNAGDLCCGHPGCGHIANGAANAIECVIRAS